MQVIGHQVEPVEIFGYLVALVVLILARSTGCSNGQEVAGVIGGTS